jgi:putative uncharacterized protein (fragment)
MSIATLIHLRETENSDFDRRKFNTAIIEKYSKTTIEETKYQSLAYDVYWENNSEQCQFALRMDRKRCTFAIEYFNSNHRLGDYASFILWLRTFFPKEKEVVLVDENNSELMILSSDTSIEAIKNWLESLGL